jgi:hypothetical protein
MTLEEAKTAAVQIFGPGTTLDRKGSTCFVKDGTGKTLGMGVSWRTALQYAARPVIEERQKQAQKRQDEYKREQTDFIEFLVEKHHEEFEKWKEARKPKKDDRQLPLPLDSDTPQSETSSSSDPAGSSPTASEG